MVDCCCAIDSAAYRSHAACGTLLWSRSRISAFGRPTPVFGQAMLVAGCVTDVPLLWAEGLQAEDRNRCDSREQHTSEQQAGGFDHTATILPTQVPEAFGIQLDQLRHQAVDKFNGFCQITTALLAVNPHGFDPTTGFQCGRDARYQIIRIDFTPTTSELLFFARRIEV